MSDPRHIVGIADTITPVGAGAEVLGTLPGDPKAAAEAARRDADALTAGGRFEIRRRLGAGAFGVVYEAYDQQRRARVALKTLHHADSRRLYSLKQEFRALADVSHDNLVTLYELGTAGDTWFLAMELIDDGVDLLTWVRPSPPRGGAPRLDEARLRDALRQLVSGVRVLHAHGILHSDLKPSNVLVQPDGRTVILDFGLVALRDVQMDLGPGVLSGTPGYMSPEQAFGGEAIGPASDWYAVGVMLYEALTGELPFCGTTMSVLMQKASDAAPDPRAVQPAAPADLSELCMALMANAPASRPEGEEIMERLGVGGLKDTADTLLLRPGGFVGRQRHLKRLRGASARMREGEAAAVFLQGPSGIGKSSLVRHFLDEMSDFAPDTVVLSGRCFAQESVPYKAFDGIVDALHGVLLSLPEGARAELLPEELPLLSRLFPILSSLHALWKTAPEELADDQELKRRALRVLRELFLRLATTRPVVLVIDDLQWADPDSVGLLAELMRAPDPPPLLLIGMYRSEDTATSAVLRELRAARPFHPEHPQVSDLDVGPLTDDESEALASALLREARLPDEDAASILADARGEPFLIQESIRLAAAGFRLESGPGLERRAAIDAMLSARVARLPPRARDLLEVIAVASLPIHRDIASEAAGLGPGAARSIATLRSHSLIRELGAPDEDHVEAYHDRIREVAAARVVGAQRVAMNRALAEQLEAAGGADSERLMVHWSAAGEGAKATRYAVTAAEQASQSLAFDRAAQLYEQALALGHLEGAAEREARVRLGDACRDAGRGAKAAVAYLAAADLAQGDEERLRLRSAASAQYLQCGMMKEGLDIGREVLGAVGERLPGGTLSAVVRLLAAQARLKLRGLRYEERSAAELDPKLKLRLDATYEMATTLALTDEIVGSFFGARYLELALSAGEPRHLAIATGTHGAFLALSGDPRSPAVTRLIALSEELTARLHDPFTSASAEIVRAVLLSCEGRYAEGLPYAERAYAGFVEQCIGVPWDRAVARFYVLQCQLWAGRIDEMGLALTGHLADAEARGDIYTQLYLRTLFVPQQRLVEDRPRDIVVELEAARALRRDERFQMHHWWTMASDAQRLLYEGRGPEACERVRGTWSRMKRALLLSVDTIRIEALLLRARCALASALADPARRGRHLRRARRDAARLNRSRWPFARALATMILGAVAAAEGDLARARRDLAAADAALVECDLPLPAAACRRLRGALSEGAAGAELVAAADAQLRARGVVNPQAYARIWLPLDGASGAIA